ncbi:MAG: ComF family protein [Thermoleophilia bacterium]|nr:ComF family protein [Thermoleophilia bacterium]
MRLLDLLLPVRCAVCAAPGGELCAPCLASLPPLRPPLCERCGAPSAWPVARCRECGGRRLAFATARAAVAYDARVRSLVAAWKERGLRGLARPAADVVAACVRARPGADALVAVPADRERALTRGHHPAHQLADELAARWDVPLLTLLERPVAAPRQRGLPSSERRRNVARAFRARDRSPARVVLVDDVYTTGATASAAASALRAAGARRVEVVTFARALRVG